MQEILTTLETSSTLFIIVITITGLMVGSFLNVVIYRYPIMLFREWSALSKELLTDMGYSVSGEPSDKRLLDNKFNMVIPRSRCPKCNHLIRSWENIPVLSYLFQLGKCAQCKSKISPRYPFVELLTGLAFAWVAYSYGWSWQTALFTVLSSLLIVQIFIDFDHKILPDNINYIILWLGLSASAAGLTIPLFNAVIGALLGYLSLWTFYWAFKLLTKKEGMGHGDFKLLAAIGAFIGFKQLLLVIILSAGVGAIVGIAMMLLKIADRDKQIPFGPYLATAGWITIFWGDPILRYYFNVAGF